MKLRAKILVGFMAIIALMGILGGVTYSNFLEINQQFEFLIVHDLEVLQNAQQLQKHILDAETGQKGFIIVGEESFLEPYYSGIIGFAELVKIEKELVSDNPPQVQRLERIERLFTDWNEKAAIPEIELARIAHQTDINSKTLEEVLTQGVGKGIIDELKIVLDESKPTLKRLHKLLKRHKTLNIQLRGHTNGVGTQTSPEGHLKLSIARTETIEKFLIEADFPYIIGYGLTETAPLLSGSILGKPNKYKSCGIAMPGVELQIKNKNPQTGEGEIIAKSPSIMINYYKDEKQTSEVMQDGWFLTGDLGYIDDDGYLFISGRSKNVIIGSAGENIYPEQIEATINQNEAVVDSLVMQKDAKLVARIHLDYELIDNILGTHKYSDTQIREEILTYLEDMRIDVNSKISSFSRMIKFIEQIEPFVKTPTKKIKRYLYTN